MKSDLRGKLEMIVASLENEIACKHPRPRIKDELHDIVVTLKHILDFDLPRPPSNPNKPASDFRLLFCKQCGTSYMRQYAPEIRCETGHLLSFDD